MGAPHLTIELKQSDRVVVPGSRLTLAATITLPSDVHVYVPGVQVYKSIVLDLQSSQDAQFLPPTYPTPKVLFLPAIKERVPVFEGTFRIAADAKISATPELMQLLGTNGKSFTIAGQLHYQACDKTTCYVPTSIPVSWQVQILPLDRQRSPEAIQHKGGPR